MRRFVFLLVFTVMAVPIGAVSAQETITIEGAFTLQPEGTYQDDFIKLVETTEENSVVYDATAGGGPATGTGRLVTITEVTQGNCVQTYRSTFVVMYTGVWEPQSLSFSGTWTATFDHVLVTQAGECEGVGYGKTIEPLSGSWNAPVDQAAGTVTDKKVNYLPILTIDAETLRVLTAAPSGDDDAIDVPGGPDESSDSSSGGSSLPIWALVSLGVAAVGGLAGYLRLRLRTRPRFSETGEDPEDDEAVRSAGGEGSLESGHVGDLDISSDTAPFANIADDLSGSEIEVLTVPGDVAGNPTGGPTPDSASKRFGAGLRVLGFAGRVTTALENDEFGFGVEELDDDDDSDAQFVTPMLYGSATMHLKGEFFADGEFVMPPLVLRSRPMIGTLFNELWHAYSNLVVAAGGDPDLQEGIEFARLWIRDEAETKTGPASDKITDVDNFTEEYLSTLNERMATVHFQLKLRVEGGQLTAEEATEQYQDFLGGADAAGLKTSRIVGYESRSTVGSVLEGLGVFGDTSQTITNSPPRQVTEPIADAFGFGRF